MSRIINLNNLCKAHKTLNDSVHGMFKISKFASLIIDHPYFQRLRYLKQLGACSYVYPNAVHTRFEHSIGTYYLAKKILNVIKHNSNPQNLIEPLMHIKNLEEYFKEKEYKENKENIANIDLDEYVIELISIGALCHDLGHGPYSHMFDDIFVPNLEKIYPNINLGLNKSHENRSVELLKIIINQTEMLKTNITQNEINFICNLINPDKLIHTGYIYQTVSNNLNGLDVDKFDYLTRDAKMLGLNISFQSDRLINNAKVIDNCIMYCKQLIPDIINLFNTRHYMHKTVYCHKGVISIDYMLSDLMLKLNRYINFSELFTDLSKFVEFTDYDILTHAKIYKHDEEIKKIYDLISQHKLYQLIFSKTIDKTNKKFEIDDFIKLENKSDYILHQSIIGYISGNNKNPLENIFLYSTKDDSVVKLMDSNLTKLMPDNFQETLIMIFYKNKDKLEEIQNKII